MDNIYLCCSGLNIIHKLQFEIFYFIVISACSSLSTSFLKSKSGSRIEEGCDDLFLIAIFRNWGVRVIVRISVIFVFCSHECLVNMLYGLVFGSSLLVIWSFRLVVYEFHCIELLDVVCFFQNQTFWKFWYESFPDCF